MSKHVNVLIWILYTALGILAAWIAFRFLLPWILPFLLALLTARLIEPFIGVMTRKFRFRRSFAALIASVFALALMLLIVGVLIQQVVNGVGLFVQYLPELASSVGETIGRLESSLYHFIIAAPPETQNMMLTATQSIGVMLEELPTQISGALLSFAGNTATAFPGFFLFILTYAISVLFISMSYPQVLEFVKRQIPPRWRAGSKKLGKDLKQTGIKWCKAQLKLISVTFVLLTASFLILRVPYGIFLAVAIALIDAFPVVGTGTVLIPWGIFALLGGNIPMGIGILLTYALVSITHSVMEPRFVGAQLGLHPLVTLMAMYLGFRLIGVIGMITFPLMFILIKQFHDGGYVKLWR